MSNENEKIHWRLGNDPVTFIPTWGLYIPGKIFTIRTKLGPSDVKHFEDEIFIMMCRLKDECELTPDEFRLALTEYVLLLAKLKEQYEQPSVR